MEPDLTGQKVAITGITSGIGRASARLLLSMGAEVVFQQERKKSSTPPFLTLTAQSLAMSWIY